MKKIEKPWGYEIIWAESSKSIGYVGKIIHINPGHRLSMQFHETKEETILVKSGVLYIETIGDLMDNRDLHKAILKTPTEIRLVPGEVFHVTPFLTHRFIAKEESVEIIEVSTKHLDDVVRICDDYGRT
jgi:mannose-6-phosphate isomerase